MLNLVTMHGQLDLAFTPAGTDGHDSLARNASPRAVGGLLVQVASLDDVTARKRPLTGARTSPRYPSCTGSPIRQRDSRGDAARDFD